jgi:hypothetical protein
MEEGKEMRLNTLISLPTSLQLPRFGSAVRVTHRFAQPLPGDFGALAGNLFGLDSGAQIGLEYRSGSCETARSACTAPATGRSSFSVNMASSGRSNGHWISRRW